MKNTLKAKKEIIRNLSLSGIGEEFIVMQLDLDSHCNTSFSRTETPKIFCNIIAKAILKNLNSLYNSICNSNTIYNYIIKVATKRQY